MREKFLKRAATAALEIEEDLDMEQDELDKKIFSIFVAARRRRKDVEDEVGVLNVMRPLPRRERKKKARERDRLSILILTLVVLLEESRAREVLADVEVSMVVNGLRM